jgi:parallel beta-helix repeat protein
MHPVSHYIAFSALTLMILLGASCSSRVIAEQTPRVVTVAQSGPADVVGDNSEALQKAAHLLHPGDTLSIAAGTYTMDNSLFVPSGVTVRGVAGKTILQKSRGIESPLVEDGDYGETFLALAEPQKFHPGMGIAVTDDTSNSGWAITISSVAEVKAPYVIINPMTVRDYDEEQHHARVTNTFPILCAIDGANIVLEDLVVDGNRAENAYIDGCRGGAIYMYRVRNVTVRNCTARNYNGDGISFQISDGVQVLNSESYGHAGYGVHPGTGSVNSLVKNCHMRDNGDIGLFLCWRVRHGRFENNVIENNGHYGISIGHKDTDNEFVGNTIARNGITGVYFRRETPKNSGSRNVFRDNKVLDNGNAREGYGFYIEPHAGDLVINGNQIGDTRSTNPTQRYGIYKARGAGSIDARNNSMSGHSAQDYHDAGLRADARR